MVQTLLNCCDHLNEFREDIYSLWANRRWTHTWSSCQILCFHSLKLPVRKMIKQTQRTIQDGQRSIDRRCYHCTIHCSDHACINRLANKQWNNCALFCRVGIQVSCTNGGIPEDIPDFLQYYPYNSNDMRTIFLFRIHDLETCCCPCNYREVVELTKKQKGDRWQTSVIRRCLSLEG